MIYTLSSTILRCSITKSIESSAQSKDWLSDINQTFSPKLRPLKFLWCSGEQEEMPGTTHLKMLCGTFETFTCASLMLGSICFISLTWFWYYLLFAPIFLCFPRCV